MRAIHDAPRTHMTWRMARKIAGSCSKRTPCIVVESLFLHAGDASYGFAGAGGWSVSRGVPYSLTHAFRTAPGGQWRSVVR